MRSRSLVQILLKRLLLLESEPHDLLRPIGQEEIYEQAEKDCWSSFKDEEPLPAPEAGSIDAKKDCVGDWRADGIRERNGGDEDGHDAGAYRRRQPECQVQYDAGVKASCSRAEQEPEHKLQCGTWDKSRI